MDEFSSSHNESGNLESQDWAGSPPYLNGISFNDLPDVDIGGTGNESFSTDPQFGPLQFDVWAAGPFAFSSSSLQLSSITTSNQEFTGHAESSSSSGFQSQASSSLSIPDLTALCTRDPAPPRPSSAFYLQGDSFIFDPMVHLQTEVTRSIWGNREMGSFNNDHLPMDSSWGDIAASSVTSYPAPLPQLEDVSPTLHNTPVIPQKRPVPEDSASPGREQAIPLEETPASAEDPPSEEQTKAAPRRSNRQHATTAQYAALDWDYERKKRTPKKQRVGL
jgi:hypothetical protein